MTDILNFLADNYLYFLIGAVVLLFALIGFAVQGRKKKTKDVNPMQPFNSQVPNTPINNQMPSNANAQMPNNVQAGTIPDLNSLQVNNNVDVSNPSEPIAPSMSTNSDTLTFGPISAEEPSNTEMETLDLTPSGSEPVMETLGLGTPQMDMPVSMEPEQPMNIAKPQETVLDLQPSAPADPGFNNTIQQ